MGDIAAELKGEESIRAQSATATLDGTGIDLGGTRGKLVLISLGLFAGTTPTATVEIQESDDDVSYSAVAVGDLTGGGQLATIDTTNDEQIHERGYVGVKKFLRVAITAITGASASLPIAAMIVRQGRKLPT